MSSEQKNKTPENNLTEAQDYLKNLELPEGFTFELHHNGKKTMVLEDVSLDSRLSKKEYEKFAGTLSEQVEAFNGNDDLPKEVKRQTFAKKEKDMEILKSELADKIYDQTKKTCCGRNCTIKETPGGNTQREYLKTLNDVKTPEAFFNYLEDILKREQLMIEDFKKFLTDLKESFMTTEKAKDYEYRENYIFFMYCLFNDILDNLDNTIML